MVTSAGKLLREARLKKNILIEDAARATKIRPNRIAELETDDYTHFANMAYAKGFLLIYAKYLEVNVSEFTKAMDVGSPVGVGDYEYLNQSRSFYELESSRKKNQPKKLNYKLLITILITILCTFWVIQFANKLERVNPDTVMERKHNAVTIPSPQPTPTQPVPTSTATPTPTPVVTQMPVVILPSPEPTPEPSIEIRKAEPIMIRVPSHTPTPSPTDVKKRNQSRTH